ncbi:hypothetical protein FPHOBKDP_00187 [Listeria phage LPJP1]|nr:hypothetical protein FPHOBKDP_00187 [Listeria phage LPJP1]
MEKQTVIVNKNNGSNKIVGIFNELLKCITILLFLEDNMKNFTLKRFEERLLNLNLSKKVIVFLSWVIALSLVIFVSIFIVDLVSYKSMFARYWLGLNF